MPFSGSILALVLVMGVWVSWLQCHESRTVPTPYWEDWTQHFT